VQVVGLGGGLHDRSACLFEDGRLTVAIENERLTRTRYGVDHQLLTECFDRGNFRPLWISNAREGTTPEVGYVVNGRRPQLVAHQLQKASSLWRFSDLPLADALFRSRGMPSHHFAHAASAFLVSPFEEAAVVVLDGFGSVDPRQRDCAESTSVWRGQGSELRLVRRWYSRRVPRRTPVRARPSAREVTSLGVFYSDVSIACGFRVLDAGKTMGLAPWGDNRYTAELRSFVNLSDDGSVEIDPGYLDWLIAREAERAELTDAAQRDELTAAVARAGQECLEAAVLHVVRWALANTSSVNLCLAGGVALNAVANRRILVDTDVKALYVQPAASDAGIGIGAAAWHYFQATKAERSWVMNETFGGRPYDDQAIVAALRGSGLIWRPSSDPAAEAVAMIAREEVVAWFQGGSEFGPRALGNRSILADPRPAWMRDHINQVKAREWFRPLAPSVLAEHQADWFEFGHDLPFMIVCAQARPERRDRIPAVVHVDGSSRIQSVHADRTPLYHRLISEFYQRTGVPMVLNTSFNIRGPIVETPQHAVDTFAASGLDALVIGDYVVRRPEARGQAASGTPHSVEDLL
jgi:carbamoyltransferase